MLVRMGSEKKPSHPVRLMVKSAIARAAAATPAPLIRTHRPGNGLVLFISIAFMSVAPFVQLDTCLSMVASPLQRT